MAPTHISGMVEIAQLTIVNTRRFSRSTIDQSFTVSRQNGLHQIANLTMGNLVQISIAIKEDFMTFFPRAVISSCDECVITLYIGYIH